VSGDWLDRPDAWHYAHPENQPDKVYKIRVALHARARLDEPLQVEGETKQQGLLMESWVHLHVERPSSQRKVREHYTWSLAERFYRTRGTDNQDQREAMYRTRRKGFDYFSRVISPTAKYLRSYLRRFLRWVVGGRPPRGADDPAASEADEAFFRALNTDHYHKRSGAHLRFHPDYLPGELLAPHVNWHLAFRSPTHQSTFRLRAALGDYAPRIVHADGGSSWLSPHYLVSRRPGLPWFVCFLPRKPAEAAPVLEGDWPDRRKHYNRSRRYSSVKDCLCQTEGPADLQTYRRGQEACSRSTTFTLSDEELHVVYRWRAGEPVRVTLTSRVWYNQPEVLRYLPQEWQLHSNAFQTLREAYTQFVGPHARLVLSYLRHYNLTQTWQALCGGRVCRAQDRILHPFLEVQRGFTDLDVFSQTEGVRWRKPGLSEVKAGLKSLTAKELFTAASYVPTVQVTVEAPVALNEPVTLPPALPVVSLDDLKDLGVVRQQISRGCGAQQALALALTLEHQVTSAQGLAWVPTRLDQSADRVENRLRNSMGDPGFALLRQKNSFPVPSDSSRLWRAWAALVDALGRWIREYGLQLKQHEWVELWQLTLGDLWQTGLDRPLPRGPGQPPDRTPWVKAFEHSLVRAFLQVYRDHVRALSAGTQKRLDEARQQAREDHRTRVKRMAEDRTKPDDQAQPTEAQLIIRDQRVEYQQRVGPFRRKLAQLQRDRKYARTRAEEDAAQAALEQFWQEQTDPHLLKILLQEERQESLVNQWDAETQAEQDAAL